MVTVTAISLARSSLLFSPCLLFTAHRLPLPSYLLLPPLPRDIWEGVKVLSLVLVSCYAMYEFCAQQGLEAGQAVSQVLFWLLLLVLCLFSSRPGFRGLRRFLARRVVVFVTGAKVEFVDVLTADALTSMSKLLADMQVRGGGQRGESAMSRFRDFAIPPLIL